MFAPSSKILFAPKNLKGGAGGGITSLKGGIGRRIMQMSLNIPWNNPILGGSLKIDTRGINVEDMPS